MLREQVDLQPYNTMALHARAAYFCETANMDELQAALVMAKEKNIPVFPLGDGSNIVLTKDYSGVVLRYRDDSIKVEYQDDDVVRVRVGAGLRWHDWVEKSLAEAWYGLENLALIPGTVGASPVQNIGAYGVEVSSFVFSVRGVFIESGELFELDNTACHFAYRNSIFKQALAGKTIITSVVFQLSRSACIHSGYAALHNYLSVHNSKELESNSLTPWMIKEAVCAVRRSRLPDPVLLPNVGSFFKNPQISSEHFLRLRERHPDIVFYPGESGLFKIAAGWLIDQLGWKGRCMGSACVHEQQALVLVNRGADASGKEVLALADAIASDVQREFSITLEYEPWVL